MFKKVFEYAGPHKKDLYGGNVIRKSISLYFVNSQND